jgi:hypothetical protein
MLKKIVLFIVVFSIIVTCECFLGLVPSYALNTGSVRITADNFYDVYVNGVLAGSTMSSTDIYDFRTAETYSDIAFQAGNNVIAICGKNDTVAAGAVADILLPNGSRVVTDGSWKVSTTLQSGWETSAFDDSSWSAATVEQAFGTGIWHNQTVTGMPSDTDASWIWASSVSSQQYVYLRCTVNIPAPTMDITMTADNSYMLYVNGQLIGDHSTYDVWDWKSAETYGDIQLQPGNNVIAIKGINQSSVAGILADITLSDGYHIGTGSAWKVSNTETSGWQNVGFDDSSWSSATEQYAYGGGVWGTMVSGMPTNTPGYWIWSSTTSAPQDAYVRFNYFVGP